MKTPGVYVEEISAFPNSIVGVATAVPAFVGYTEKAVDGNVSLVGKARKIHTLSEYESIFGGAHLTMFDLQPASPVDSKNHVFTAEDGKDYRILSVGAPIPKGQVKLDLDAAIQAIADARNDLAAAENALASNPSESTLQQKVFNAKVALNAALSAASQPSNAALLSIKDDGDRRFRLFDAMRLFFQNGGGDCYVVSVGDYSSEFLGDALEDGLHALLKEQEPTTLVVPDAVSLDRSECMRLIDQMVLHCGEKTKGRFAILDVWGGDRERQDFRGDVIEQFRGSLASHFLSHAAAYYPWIETSVVSPAEVSMVYLTSDARRFLSGELVAEFDLAAFANDGAFEDALLTPDPADSDAVKVAKKRASSLRPLIEALGRDLSGDNDAAERARIHKALYQLSDRYKRTMDAVRDQLNILPPSSAMAGLFTAVDNARGVWKAPANVSVASAVRPTVTVTHDDQEDLNTPLSGMSVNAIRSFPGRGILVWGARTLDGNSQDWRYINVRRTLNFLEESICLATQACVFEPNDANTWLRIKSMIENFLTGVWKAGGLAGSKPEDAFAVRIGLGETMTPVDILEGRMRFSIMVAMTRPAEFIVLDFEQQMQSS